MHVNPSRDSTVKDQMCGTGTVPDLRRDVLVFAPHPDDEALGCGGSIAVHRRAGRSVRVVFMTSGEAGGHPLSRESSVRLREEEASAAADVFGLGAEDLTFLRFPDGGIDPASFDQVGAVTALLRAARPQLLYVPHPADASFDHQAAFQVCWRAAGMAGSVHFPEWGSTAYWVPTILGYEVWSPISRPEYTEDISDLVEAKLRALGCYRSQSQSAKGTGQADYAGAGGLALGRFRGAMSTGGYREAFQVLRLGRVI